MMIRATLFAALLAGCTHTVVETVYIHDEAGPSDAGHDAAAVGMDANADVADSLIMSGLGDVCVGGAPPCDTRPLNGFVLECSTWTNTTTYGRCIFFCNTQQGKDACLANGGICAARTMQPGSDFVCTR